MPTYACNSQVTSGTDDWTVLNDGWQLATTFDLAVHEGYVNSGGKVRDFIISKS